NTAPLPAPPLVQQDISSKYYYVYNYSNFIYGERNMENCDISTTRNCHFRRLMNQSQCCRRIKTLTT
ncbi:MAG: hypothetical protein ACKPKO_59250, partial [Candidatus Fonsibacter sp.]